MYDCDGGRIINDLLSNQYLLPVLIGKFRNSVISSIHGADGTDNGRTIQLKVIGCGIILDLVITRKINIQIIHRFRSVCSGCGYLDGGIRNLNRAIHYADIHLACIIRGISCRLFSCRLFSNALGSACCRRIVHALCSLSHCSTVLLYLRYFNRCIKINCFIHTIDRCLRNTRQNQCCGSDRCCCSRNNSISFHSKAPFL